MHESTDEINRLNEKINSLQVEIDNILHMNVAQRITCKLVKICQGRIAFRLPVTKGTLALQVGIEQETFSRTIPRLIEYGVSIVEKNVTITDKKIIAKKVCETCAGRYTCHASKALMAQEVVH